MLVLRTRLFATHTDSHLKAMSIKLRVFIYSKSDDAVDGSHDGADDTDGIQTKLSNACNKYRPQDVGTTTVTGH